MESNMNRYLAIDLGGSKLASGVVDDAGVIHSRESVATPTKGGPDAVLEQIERMCRPLLAEHGPVAGAGMTLPGIVDAADGILTYAPYSGWQNVPFARMVSSSLGIGVQVENDVNACALAEVRFGAAENARCLLWITVSTGIGGGIVVDGQLMGGTHGLAGEIGHVIVNEDGARCGCGNNGCLEAEAAGPAWRRKALALMDRGRRTMLTTLSEGNADRIDARMIADAARRGDSLSIEVAEGAAEMLARGLAAAINVLDPDLIIVGGGVGLAFDLMQPVIDREIPRRCIPAKFHRCSVRSSALGYDAALIGAATLAMPPR